MTCFFSSSGGDIVPLVWRVQVFPSFWLLTRLRFIVNQEKRAVKEVTEVMFKNTHSLSHGTTIPFKPQHRKAARISTYAGQPCSTSFLLKDILFPMLALWHSEHAAVFFTLAWAPAPNYCPQPDLPCNNWDLTLTAEQTQGFQEYYLLVRDDHSLLQIAVTEFTYTGYDTKKPLALSFTSIQARRTDSLSSRSSPFFKFHFQVTHQTTQDNLLMHTSQSLYKG